MRFFPRSLRFRVLFYVFITSLFMMVMLGSLIFQQTRYLTTILAQEELLEMAKKIASYIEYDWKGKFELDLPQRYVDYYKETDYSEYAVLSSGGEVLFHSDGFTRNSIKNTLNGTGKYYFHYETKDGELFTGLKYDYLFEGNIYPIYVLEYEEEFTELLSTLEQDFFLNIMFFGLPLLLIQAIFIVFIFRDAFSPVFRVSRDAQNITFENLSFRLDEKDIHDEILPLVHGVNMALARLEKSAKSQKFFIANAAHELRTPISILKARITSLKDEKEIYMLNQDLRNINRLISQMLDISRLDAPESFSKSEISLNKLAQKACADIGELYVSANKELSLIEREKNQMINGNEDILYRAILNLLENALKHTPDKSPVKVIVEDRRIIVRDYGNPISEDNQMRIFEAFEKAPENINSKGSGLGLAIVSKAADIHKGSIALETRKDGNDFVFRF